MKYAYVARQPILDDRLRTVGFELLFRDGPANCFPAVSAEVATQMLLSEQYLGASSETVDNNRCYINFPYQALVNQVPRAFDQHRIVVEVSPECTPDAQLLKSVKALAGLGYTIALDNFVAHRDWKPFLPYIKIIKFDISRVPLHKIERFINKLYMSGVKFIAAKVEDYQHFEQAQLAGFDYFQGFFFSKPEMIRNKAVEPAVTTVARLMTLVYKPEIDYKAVERLFANDVALSFNLLRYANSASTVVSQIKSISQAIAYIGQDRLKRFVAMIAVTAINQAKPDYLYVLSMQRARFCQMVVEELHVREGQSGAFLVGMFSLLDALLDQSMRVILDSIPLDEVIKKAILERDGVMGCALSLVVAYEQAQWESVSVLAAELGLGVEQVAQLYNSATDWSDNIFADYH